LEKVAQADRCLILDVFRSIAYRERCLHCSRVAKTTNQQELAILLYVHLCSSSGRCRATDLSGNDNQEALGIEARKNEIKKTASMGIKEKRIKSSARFGIFGRGKSAPPQCRISSHLENCTQMLI
jgi:hypothetical protein